MIDPYQKQTLDEEEQKSLRSMLRALQPFRELPHDMPLQYVVTFLWVAVNEGLGVTDYAQRAGVAQSVMTRRHRGASYADVCVLDAVTLPAVRRTFSV
jgi:hypothetical protein